MYRDDTKCMETRLAMGGTEEQIRYIISEPLHLDRGCITYSLLCPIAASILPTYDAMMI